MQHAGGGQRLQPRPSEAAELVGPEEHTGRLEGSPLPLLRGPLPGSSPEATQKQAAEHALIIEAELAVLFLECEVWNLCEEFACS